VDADILDIGFRGHRFPEPLEVNHRPAWHIAREQEAASYGHITPAQPDQGHGLVRDRHSADAALLGADGLLGPNRQIEVELINALFRLGTRFPCRLLL